MALTDSTRTDRFTPQLPALDPGLVLLELDGDLNRAVHALLSITSSSPAETPAGSIRGRTHRPVRSSTWLLQTASSTGLHR